MFTAPGRPPTAGAPLRVHVQRLILLAVVPLVGLHLYVGGAQRRSARDAAVAETLRLARTAREHHALLVVGAAQLLPVLARVLQDGPGDSTRCAALLADLLVRWPVYANLGVAAPDGTVVCSALPLPAPVTIADRAYFRGAVRHRTFAIGEYQIGRITGQPSINFGYPLIAPTGAVRGVVFAALHLTALERAAARIGLPEGGVLVVIDRNGTVLARQPRIEALIGRRAADGSTLARISTAVHEGTVEGVGADGVRRLYGYAPVEHTASRGRIVVAVGIPLARIYADSDRATAVNVAGVLVVAGLVLVAAMLVADRQVLRPAQAIAEVVRRLGAGHLDARIGAVRGARELREMAAAFDEMAAGLQAKTAELARLHGALEQHAADLERLVAARTAELEDARQAAEAANRAKSEFLSRMSHELRTPLNAIVGFAQLLEMDGSTDRDREATHHILSASRHLLTLIDEVLDLARIEAGRMTISVEPVPVADLLRETLDLLRPLATGRAVTLSCAPCADEALHVMADAQRLKQVLLNLGANAIKYNVEGGTVTISVAQSPGGRVRIAVADTGVGIAPEQTSRLFVPFERLGADATGIEGTGLGLALSRRLTEAMGGAIGYEPRPGGGSVFWVELPAAASPTTALQRVALADGLPADPAAAGATYTVLYLEDNVSNLRLVERVLARRPHIRLVPAMQGSLGWALALEHRPDLVLLDLHLPDIPGEELLRRFHAHPHLRHVPVVVLSADATQTRIQQVRDLGAVEYLTKPINVPRLLQVVDEALTHARRPAG